MPKQKRIKTKYAGVYYIEGTNPGTGKPERIFYIMYRKGGRKIEEKAGRQCHGMTAAKANRFRADKLAGKRLTNAEKRKQREARQRADAKKWTIDRLWHAYRQTRREGKSLDTDAGRYENYLRPVFGRKTPVELDQLSVDRLRKKILKKKSDHY